MVTIHQEGLLDTLIFNAMFLMVVPTIMFLGYILYKGGAIFSILPRRAKLPCVLLSIFILAVVVLLFRWKQGYVIFLLFLALEVIAFAYSMYLLGGTIISLYRKVPKYQFVLGLAIVLIGIPWLIYYNILASIRAIVPGGLEVKKVLYHAATEAKFGPGDEQSGISMFVLPEEIAYEISEKGISFFQNLNSIEYGDDHRLAKSFRTWKTTPVQTEDRHWSVPPGSKPKIEHAFVYSRLEIEPEVSELATRAINKQGSYYSYGRYGMLIVNPLDRRVFYVWSG